MNKGIGIVLLVAVLVLGVFAWVTSKENGQLRSELAELKSPLEGEGLIGAVPYNVVFRSFLCRVGLKALKY
ncbi:MAG: hypothetical protein AAF591_12255 [Verrucomicrobiota bacterium]